MSKSCWHTEWKFALWFDTRSRRMWCVRRKFSFTESYGEILKIVGILCVCVCTPWQSLRMFDVGQKWNRTSAGDGKIVVGNTHAQMYCFVYTFIHLPPLARTHAYTHSNLSIAHGDWVLFLNFLHFFTWISACSFSCHLRCKIAFSSFAWLMTEFSVWYFFALLFAVCAHVSCFDINKYLIFFIIIMRTFRLAQMRYGGMDARIFFICSTCCIQFGWSKWNTLPLLTLSQQSVYTIF